MKNVILYIVICISLNCSAPQNAFATKKQTNWSKSFRNTSKDPYGTFLAYQSLSQLFPHAKISTSTKIFKKDHADYEPLPDSVTLKILIANDFDISTDELEKMLQYIAAGNYVFFAAENIDEYLLGKFGLHTVQEESSSSLVNAQNGQQYYENQTFFIGNEDDSDRYTFAKALPSKNALEDLEIVEEDSNTVSSNSNQTYYDPIRHNLFDVWDLGGTAQSNINFIMIRYGKGRLFLHTAPLLFSNYFLMQNKNKEYLEKALTEYIPGNISQIFWHQYLYHRRDVEEQKPNSALHSLGKYPMWMAAILLAAFGLLFYILFNGKRRQREVPIIEPLTNTSIDFAETIGQLYFHKQDHKNMAEKIIAHFLEFIRTHFNINTNKLDDYFREQLCKKSGANRLVINELVDTINIIKNMQEISAPQLVNLYTLIQQFKKHYQ
jgi:hypothetical protein